MSFNWNVFLASFIIWHEIKRGPKYGINTVMPESLKKLTIPEGDISKSSPYEAVSFYLLEIVLNSFRKFSNSPSIVDLGCGKGRVMAAAAFFGFTSITGIDFAKELCEEAIKNMKKIESRFKHLQWNVVYKDVLNYTILSSDKVFFMSNPFDKGILKKFLEKIEISLKSFPRTIWFIYASPLHLDVLLQYEYKILQHIHPNRMLNAVILKKASLSSESSLE